MVLTGLDTDLARDVSINAQTSTESDLVTESIDMTHDLGKLETARVLQNNQLRGIRTEMMMFNACKCNLYSKIGDILQADLLVPPEDRIDGRVQQFDD